jgi:hypothetical protein
VQFDWEWTNYVRRHISQTIPSPASQFSGGIGPLIRVPQEGHPRATASRRSVFGVAGSGMLTTPAQIAVAEVADQTTVWEALGVLILEGRLTSSIMWSLTGRLKAGWSWQTKSCKLASCLLSAHHCTGSYFRTPV